MRRLPAHRRNRDLKAGNHQAATGRENLKLIEASVKQEAFQCVDIFQARNRAKNDKKSKSKKVTRPRGSVPYAIRLIRPPNRPARSVSTHPMCAHTAPSRGSTAGSSRASKRSSVLREVSSRRAARAFAFPSNGFRPSRRIAANSSLTMPLAVCARCQRSSSKPRGRPRFPVITRARPGRPGRCRPGACSGPLLPARCGLTLCRSASGWRPHVPAHWRGYALSHGYEHQGGR